MTTQIKRRRGTAAEHTSFTGADAELTVNTTNKSVHVHDGTTVGGHELARADGSNVGNFDVTGTVTADGLTVDGVIDVTSTTSLSTNLQNTGGSALLPTYSFNGSADVGMYCPSVNNLGLVTGQVERIRIDSSGNVGIGTSNPASLLHIESDSSDPTLRITNKTIAVIDTGPDIEFWNNPFTSGTTNSYESGAIRVRKTNGTSNNHDHYMSFWTRQNSPEGINERMRIDASGRVLIGPTTARSNFYNSTASAALQVEGSGDAGRISALRSDSAGTLILGYTPAASSGNVVGSVSFQGNDNSEFVELASIQAAVDGTPGANDMPGRLVFNTTADGASSPTERMRIKSDGSCRWTPDGTNADMTLDASGNLLVGQTTSTAPASGNVIGAAISPLGYISTNRTGVAAEFGTRSDGDIAVFRKDGLTVGAIASVAAGMAFYATGVNNCGWHLADNSAMLPMKNSALSDNLVDLGGLNNRFDDIYATNGTIQTSDRNEKQDIEELSEAEQRVAVAAKSLMRKFRWKSAVEEKGDDARIHFGIIAQDLQAAFEAEGLDAGRYAMFIHSTWTDEETGEERSRMGVRYSELLAFIIAAI